MLPSTDTDIVCPTICALQLAIAYLTHYFTGAPDPTLHGLLGICWSVPLETMIGAERYHSQAPRALTLCCAMLLRLGAGSVMSNITEYISQVFPCGINWASSFQLKCSKHQTYIVLSRPTASVRTWLILALRDKTKVWAIMELWGMCGRSLILIIYNSG
jgi:hypothetical protein